MFTAQELKSLNELEMLVYQYVTAHRSAVPYMRIRELATEAHVSTTTVLHFCKKMGCEGFSQFKWKLKEENGIDIQDKDIPDALNELQTFFWRVGTPAYREKLEQAAAIIARMERIFVAPAPPPLSFQFPAKRPRCSNLPTICGSGAAPCWLSPATRAAPWPRCAT